MFCDDLYQKISKTKLKSTREGWKAAKKVYQPTFGCVEHLKTGKNTQQQFTSGLFVPLGKTVTSLLALLAGVWIVINKVTRILYSPILTRRFEGVTSLTQCAAVTIHSWVIRAAPHLWRNWPLLYCRRDTFKH